MKNVMIQNFRWLIRHRIAGSAVPRSVEDIQWLRLQGIDTIISLSRIAPDVRRAITELGIRHQEFLIDDFGTPEYGEIDRFLSFVDIELTLGHKVLMHCFEGTGRTGTMLAIFLVHLGEDWLNAVELSGGLETGSQRLCVQMFQEQIKGDAMAC